MRIYFNKKDNEIIIVGKQGELPSVTFVEDRGANKRGRTAIDGFIVKYGLSYAPRADTIEKLCECFVGIYKDEEEIDDKEIAYFLENLSRENYFKEIYGAIWTDKGLIYVAKMNDKGELELL